MKNVAQLRAVSCRAARTTASRAARGKAKFATICAACHGPDGKGNQAMGAPNLTDKIWLHGGGESAIIETDHQGHAPNVMPAHKDACSSAEQIHVLAAYV